MPSLASKISSWFRPYRNKKRQMYFLKKHGEVKGNYKIISNNCIGGMCYHDANKEFISPTINLYVENFLFFVQHLDEYLSFDIEEEKDSGIDYPVGLLIGKNGLPSIRICFVHYSSFEDAKNKWVTRSARMASHEGKVCIIYCVPHGKDLDKEQVDALFNIKADKKVCFYKKTAVALPPDSESIRFVKIPGKYQNIDYSKYTGLLSRKRYYDYFFDIDSFIFD